MFSLTRSVLEPLREMLNKHRDYNVKMAEDAAQHADATRRPP